MKNYREFEFQLLESIINNDEDIFQQAIECLKAWLWKSRPKTGLLLIGGGERAWTADQRIMSPLLLPTELHPLKFSFGVMNRTWTDIQRNHNPRLYR